MEIIIMENSRGLHLHRACVDGNLRRAQDFVSRVRSKEELQRKLVNPEHSTRGYSPLHEAAVGGHRAILTFLLKGIDSSHAVNCLTTDGSTPLHLAAKMGHDQCVMALLAAGADPKVRDGGGRIPQQVAKQPTTRSLITARLQSEGKDLVREGVGGGGGGGPDKI